MGEMGWRRRFDSDSVRSGGTGCSTGAAGFFFNGLRERERMRCRNEYICELEWSEDLWNRYSKNATCAALDNALTSQPHTYRYTRLIDVRRVGALKQ